LFLSISGDFKSEEDVGVKGRFRASISKQLFSKLLSVVFVDSVAAVRLDEKGGRLASISKQLFTNLLLVYYD
jgi:hypothetical protein